MLFRKLFQRYRHSQLFFALLALVVVRPLVSDYFGVLVIEAFLILTLVAGIVSCATSAIQVWIFAVSGALVTAMRIVHDDPAVSPAWSFGYYILNAAWCFYVIVLLLRRVFREQTDVTRDTIYGALTAYLLFGILWTFLYAAMDQAIPGSFTLGGRGEELFDRFMGFSFATLTTLGYGNIAPTNPRADALTSFEAITGQIYLTVLVARLVGLQLAQPKKSVRGDA